MPRVIFNGKNSRENPILHIIYSLIHILYAISSTCYLTKYFSNEYAMLLSFTLFNLYQLLDTLILKDKRPLWEYVEYNIGLAIYIMLC